MIIAIAFLCFFNFNFFSVVDDHENVYSKQIKKEIKKNKKNHFII